MTFNSFSANGRTLMVKFTCCRCRAEKTETLEAHKNDDEDNYGFLHRLKPPEGWCDLLHGPLLCPACLEAYVKFMDNKKE